jgi:hypothetical protein
LGQPASREAHAKLYVNNQYAGLYTIVESIDKVFLTNHYLENGGYLYKYDYDPEDLPYYFEYKGSNPEVYSPKPFQPETHEIDPNPVPIVDMIKAINETPDGDFQRVMADYLDLTEFMTHAAIENFVADNDGFLGDYGTNNFYFYRFENTTKSTFIAWDKSEAFKGGVEYGIFHNVFDVPSWLRNRLMDRAIRVPNLLDVYLNTLLACAELAITPDPTAPVQPATRDAPLPGWLEQEIMREYQQIRAAALADSFKPFSNEEFEASVQDLLLFARNRSAFVLADVGRSRR